MPSTKIMLVVEEQDLECMETEASTQRFLRIVRHVNYKGRFWSHRCLVKIGVLFDNAAYSLNIFQGFSGGTSGKESVCQCRKHKRCRFNPGEDTATHSIFSPGKHHEQRSLVGYSPWGHKESDRTEVTEHAHKQS